MSTAKAGKIGRMYGGSFEWDLEKNRKMNPAQITPNHSTAFSRRAAQPPCSAARTAGQSKGVHGIRPAQTTQMK